MAVARSVGRGIRGRELGSSREVIRRLWETLEPHLEEQGYELVEVRFGQEGRRFALRIFVDRANGITLDDCAEVSQLLSPLLDGSDLIEGSYALEVSSPGFDRPVRKPADFERFVGEMIRVRTAAPVAGRKNFKGRLTGYAEGSITMECQGESDVICLENIERANLDR